MNLIPSLVLLLSSAQCLLPILRGSPGSLGTYRAHSCFLFSRSSMKKPMHRIILSPGREVFCPGSITTFPRSLSSEGHRFRSYVAEIAKLPETGVKSIIDGYGFGLRGNPKQVSRFPFHDPSLTACHTSASLICDMCVDREMSYSSRDFNLLERTDYPAVYFMTYDLREGPLYYGGEVHHFVVFVDGKEEAAEREAVVFQSFSSFLRDQPEIGLKYTLQDSVLKGTPSLVSFERDICSSAFETYGKANPVLLSNLMLLLKDMSSDDVTRRAEAFTALTGCLIKIKQDAKALMGGSLMFRAGKVDVDKFEAEIAKARQFNDT